MEENGWRILIGTLSFLGGGATVRWLLRGALREDLRDVFMTKTEGVTHEALEERDKDISRHWGDILEKVEHRIKEKLHSEINSLGLKLTRENEHLQQQLNVFAKGVDQALRQSTDADRRSLETRGSMETLGTRLDGIEKNLDTRLKHMESLLDILTRRTVA